MPLTWKRPVSSDYPRIWHRFSVSGENYLIQDLPLSMTKEAIKFMIDHCIKDDPLCVAYNLHENPFLLDRFGSVYKKVVIRQKATLVCFKEGSNEILGLNLNYVTCNADYDSIGDTLRNIYLRLQRFYRLCTNRRYTSNNLRNSKRNLKSHRNLIEFIKGGIRLDADEILNSTGLGVAPEYRGRGIGTELLKTRSQFCKQFNIQLTSDVFTSDASDRCAEKAGFKLVRKLSYNLIREDYPELKVPELIASSSISYRTMQIDED